MRLGSQEHKELFCRSFIDSYLPYEPETLPWQDLEGIFLERLRDIPFWKEALLTERQAGVMVSTFAQTIEDPLLREAIALQGREESRHARLIEFLIDRYGIEIDELEVQVPPNVETAFIDFGFGECLDSFFAFGLFGIARQAQYLPESMFEIFNPILDEEARHIVFFINWVTYLQIQQGRGWEIARAAHALWYYGRALWNLVQTFGGSQQEQEKAFPATGANTFMDDLTPELFFSTCLAENAQRMGAFDSRLLQPQLLPRLCGIALRVLQLLPRRPAISPGINSRTGC